MINRLSTPVTDQDHIRGNPTAPVTLVEYGDYECPYCREAYPHIREVLRQMGDNVRFVFRNFPLTQIHPHALQAAHAAEAAGKQGRFWEMHDTLFEHQDRLGERDLLRYGGELNLDISVFVQDIGSEGIERKVRDDFSSGIRGGVNGTPTFFINGVRYDGPYESEYLLEALEPENNQLQKGVSV